MVTEIWPEVWTRPGHANYGRVRDYLSFRSAGVHVGINRIGDGNFELADTFAGFDDFLLTDTVTPANSKSSTVKWFSAADPTTPIAEWLPSEIFPGGSKDDPYTKVTGVGINGILGHARLEAYDWDGTDSFECQACDWIWGGDNILGNPGFEDSQVTPTSYTLEIVASAGTYTITDGTDTTAPLAFNALSGAIEAELQGFASITDIVVADAGSSPITRLITFVDPPFGVTLTLNPAGLTGTGTLTETEDGGLSPTPWTKAAALARGLPQNIGGYTTFGVSTAQNHTPGGQYSLAIDPGPSTATSNRNPGAQQRVSVKPGVTYQASIWVRPTSGTDRFRLGLYGIGEEVIALSSSSGVTLTANTWNELTISDVVIPDDVTSLIFRIACTNPGPSNPSLFYVDDGGLFEGLVATTIGEILRLLYEDATVDHVADGRLVWEDDANPGTPYLTLDFSDTLDSAGNAWADAEISTRLTMRQSYSQIMASFVNEYRYEYRIVADDVEAGTYLWQVYNPGGMDAAPDVAVQGGASDVKRQLRRVAPGGTDQLVEALGRATARARHAGLMSALGRIEASTLSREAPDLIAAASAAASAVAQSLQDISSVGYVFTGELQAEPMTSYTLGDTVTIVDPPDIAAASKRFVDLEISVDPNKVEWEAQYGALVITNADAAVADAVAGLLNKFEYPEQEPEAAPFAAGGGGGDPTIFIACADATSQSKDMAHILATGVNDHDAWNQALQILLDEGPVNGGRIVISEGTFNVDPGEMVVTDFAHLHGMGAFRTFIQNQINGSATDALVTVQTDGEISDIGFNTTATFAGRVIFEDYGRITNIWHQGGAATALWINGAQHPIDNIQVDGDYTNAAIVVDEGWVTMNNVISLRSSTGGGGAFMRVMSGSAQVSTISNLVVSHIVSGVGHGIVIEGPDSIVLSNFAISTPGNAAILIDDNTPFNLNLATGVLIGDYGISHQGSSGLVNSKWSNLLIIPDLIGVNLQAIRRSTIDNVSVISAGQHGVRLIDSSDNDLDHIFVYQPGRDANDTYDGVILEGNSDRNDLRRVRVVGIATGNKPRWAVNISAATCDANSYLDCRSGAAANYGLNGGAGAVPYNDAGTGTINTWPGAAAPQGDNLL